MSRTAVARLLGAIALGAAVAFATPLVAGDPVRSSRASTSLTARLPAATFDAAGPENDVVVAARSDGDTRAPSFRTWSAVLTAVGALAAFTASRCTRVVPLSSRVRAARFAARRRGPPLLPAC